MQYKRFVAVEYDLLQGSFQRLDPTTSSRHSFSMKFITVSKVAVAITLANIAAHVSAVPFESTPGSVDVVVRNLGQANSSYSHYAPVAKFEATQLRRSDLLNVKEDCVDIDHDDSHIGDDQTSGNGGNGGKGGPG